ncbi:AI-2E family transporter [Massilia sp. H-1]|nr:AI-2E family transporter [Massilia sp. H-1]
MIAIFVAAIDEGWSLAIYCVALYTALELLVANVVEPKVYGHSSGLSPLAVIVSALFWGALWGPVGLLISTPLTLCLVVTGRHVRALEPISILLSDAPIVDAAQRFYHRILLGESELIIRDALAYLRNFSFASYCDNVLLPGLALGVDEFDALSKIEKAQQNNIRSSIAALAATIIPAPGSVLKRPRRKVASGTDANVGAHLRQLRQMHLGRWQGSLDVPKAGSVVLCAGLPSERDELLNELFVLALREAGVDARSASPENREERPEGVDKLVAMVFLSYPLAQSLPEWQIMARQLRSNLPHAILVTLRLLSEGEDDKEAIVARDVDMVLHSFEEGVEFASPDRSG